MHERFLSMGKRFVELATADGLHTVRIHSDMMTIAVPDSLSKGWVVSLRSPCASFLVRGPTEDARLIGVDFTPLERDDHRASLKDFGEAARAVLILLSSQQGNGVRVTVTRGAGGTPVPLRGEGAYFIPAEVILNARSIAMLWQCAEDFRLDTSLEIVPEEVRAFGRNLHHLWCVLHGSRPEGREPYQIRLTVPVRVGLDRLPLRSKPAALVMRSRIILREHVMAAACIYFGKVVRIPGADGSTEDVCLDNPDHCLLFKETVGQWAWSAERFMARVRLAARAFSKQYVVINLETPMQTPRGEPPTGSSLLLQ